MLGFLVLSGAAGAVGEQNGATGTLKVYVGGPAPAQVSVSPTPPPSGELSGRHPCVQLENEENEPCVYTLPQGPVTLTAEFSSPPAPEREFLAWSDADCGSNPVCATTLTASHAVVASFSPVNLVISVDGPGTVTATSVPGGRVDTCPSPQNPGPSCSIEYDTITEVELEGTPTNQGEHVQWGEEAFCDFGADPRTTRCRGRVNFDPSPVGVGFGLMPTPPSNFDIDVLVRVLFGGGGSGRVTGVRTAVPAVQIFNCSPDCSASLEYQRRVALTAHPDADSTFEGWRGVCSTNPRCEFNAGAVTSVRAIFGRKQQPPPPPPPPPPQPPPQPQPRTAFSTRILGVRVIRTRTARVVLARVAVNEVASGRGQVRRGRRALARRAFRLRTGRNALRMPLRARVRRGPAWFAITLTNAGGTTKSMRTRFFIPRRR